MTNCRETAKILGSQAQTAEESQVRAARLHLTTCANCRRRWSLERMAVTLIRTHAIPLANERLSPSPHFFTRLHARINAERTEATATFWEAAVATAHGWLLVFGSVTAILLAAFMLTWHARTNAPEFSTEALALPASSENIVIANSEPLSRDAVLDLFADEDYDHARK